MGRGYAAAKARRQAAAAAAAGQGAVAEPAVAAAQPVAPAPEPVTAPTEGALAERREEVFKESTFRNILQVRNEMNGIKTIERLYDNKTDAVTIMHGNDIGKRFRTVADATMLARDAASKVYEALGFNGKPQRRTEAEALAAVRLNRGVKLARSAAERLKRMGKLRSDSNSLAAARLAESSREIRQAFEIITDSARQLNLRFASPLRLED